MKLTAIALLTLGVQIGYEITRSAMINPDSVYGMDTSRIDGVINQERHLNACSPMTRQVVACVLTIPLPGDCE